jgi:hypothetical protein
MQSREPRIHKRLKSMVKVMWPGTESNCRHEDFQSSALPTELPGQKLGIFLKSWSESRLAATIADSFRLAAR